MELRNQSSSFRLVAVFAEVLLCAASGSAFAQGDIWQPRQAMPTPRRLLAAAAHDNKIYTFGGCGSPCFQPPLHTSTFEETLVEVYDTESNSWSKRDPMLTILFGAVAVAPGNGKIYTFGGFVSGDVVQEYDPAADAWIRKSPMPTPRYGLAAVALNRKVYVLGGSGPSNALEVYDPKTDTWERKAPMPTARVFLAAAAVNGKIYAIGGSPDCCGGSQTDAVEIYDPATNTWSRGAPLPVAQQVSAAAGVNGKVYVFGGFVPGVGAQGTTFEYDPETNIWTARARFPEPRDQAPAVVIADRVHILGGSIPCHCRALGDHHEYTPPLDLRIEKENGLAQVRPGQSVLYTITITNPGTEPVMNATVTDDFSSTGLTGVLWCRGEGCTPSIPGNLESTLTVPGQGTLTYRATGTVPCICERTEILNTACVTAPGRPEVCDPDLDPIVPAPGADLALRLTGPPTAEAGETASYTMAVTNQGPCTAQGVVLSHVPPEGFEPVSGSGRCAAGFPCSLGTIAPGATVTVTATSMVPDDLRTCPETVFDTASVTSSCDPDATDNTRTFATTLTCEPPILPLSIEKSDGRGEAGHGDRLIYTIVVRNPNSLGVEATVTDDLLGTGLTDVRWCTGAGCIPAPAGNLSHTITVPAEGAVTYLASGVVPADRSIPITNTACVAVAGEIQDCASDTDSIRETPEPPLDLSITKTDGQEKAAPGDRLIYTIVARNKGDRPVTAAPFTDVFEPALEQVQWCCGSEPTCVPLQTGALPATLDLPAESTQTCVLAGCVSPLFTGIQSNTATLTLPPPDIDPTPADNTATDLTRIVPPPGVTALCAGFNGFGVEGETITFTFVLWNGGSAQVDAPGPEFEDALPAGLTLVSASADSGTVTTGANTVSWDGPIPAGGRVIIMVTAVIDPGTIGTTLCNRVTVSFDSDGDGIHDTSGGLSGSPCRSCCVEVLPVPPIPALSGPGLAALVLLLAALAVLRLRKERQPG